MGWALSEGGRVKCLLPPTGRELLAKDRMTSSVLKHLTKDYSYITYIENRQPEIAKGVMVYHHFDLKFHKGYDVRWVSNYKPKTTE